MGYEYLLFLLASFFLYQLAFSSPVTHLCSKDESISLLKFKNTLTVSASYYCFYFDILQPPTLGPQSYPKTRSWNISRDCCSWDGVVCDDFTGHVIELHLGCSQLQGKIDSNSSLFQLSHLRMLNLSSNYFYNSHISPEFGKFSSLTHLDLFGSDFAGQIPSEISHLSKLQSLNLGFNFMLFGPHNFKLLLQNLTQLRELDLSYVNISSTIPPNFSSHLTTLLLGRTGLYGIIPESIFHMPNLETLVLGENDRLSGDFPKTKWNSSTSLKVLSLLEVNFSGNFLPESLGYLTVLQYLRLESCNFLGPIPRSLWNLTRLELMALGGNQLKGPIPLFISGLRNLKFLSLERNSLNGAIPSWVFSLPSLTELDLSNNHFSGQLEDFKYNTLELISLDGNQLQGPLPRSLQNLVNLTTLGLSYNNFSGNVDVSFFSNLKQLRMLDLSYNSISLTNENKVKSTLPKYLEFLYLSACEVKELDFLRSTEELSRLDLSNNKIQGRIPDWAWSNWMHMERLNLSHNMLTSIDQISSLSKLGSIDLQSNFIKGSLPILSPSVYYFFISNNSLSGEIPSFVCNLKSLTVLDLARNNLTGTIPQCFCNFELLTILDLARNKLKGTIPQCLGNMNNYLEVLDMQYNSFSGYLRTTFSSRSQLKSFNLHGNKVEGKIPRSLSNCKQLEVLDLGNNHLNDTFPMWLGTLPTLQVLSLRSNKLHGPIRASRINNLFPQLRMLDLSCNSFTAELPTRLFQKLKGMRRIDQTMNPSLDFAQRYYQDSATVVTKGLELEVVRILSLYTTIDLSNNKFDGHIPSVLGDLISLRMLNLSRNGLQGHIPPSLGKLSKVESLDLSFNKLSGEIPQQLASLTCLAVLNLSRNHLEGCIPKGPQFATFENNSYEGNDGLRGFPVSEDCGSKWGPETNKADEENDSSILSELGWKVVLMGYGCGLSIGFSIAYLMLSSRNPNWLSRIAEDLEYRIMMRRRKQQRGQMHYRRRRRRNNGI